MVALFSVFKEPLLRVLEKYDKLKYYYKRRKGECVGKKERDGERREEGGGKRRD